MSWISTPSYFLLTGLTVVLGFLILPSVDVTVQVITVGIGVAFVGLPHGAIDAYIAQRDGMWRSIGGLAVFATVYALVALSVIGAWILMPVLSLIAFLIISAWHFGAAANARNTIERWLFGSLLLSLPSFFHLASVAGLFEAISGTPARDLVPVLQVLAPVALIGVIAMLMRPRSGEPLRRIDVATISGLVLFAWALPPLVYFAVYFCALHSPTHFQRVLRLVPSSERSGALTQTAGFTVLTLFFAGIAFFVLSDTISLQQSTLQIVFIGLAALTVPHMFLVDGICRLKLGEAK